MDATLVRYGVTLKDFNRNKFSQIILSLCGDYNKAQDVEDLLWCLAREDLEDKEDAEYYENRLDELRDTFFDWVDGLKCKQKAGGRKTIDIVDVHNFVMKQF